jgi:nitronate monooxygenase
MTIHQKIQSLRNKLSIPVFVAPMFLVTSPQLVIDSCKSGVVGVLPTSNAKTVSQLDQWLDKISSTLMNYTTKTIPPWAANIIVHSSSKRFNDDLFLLTKYKPEIVITALGSPERVVKQVHKYGGMVFADVSSVKYAKKAISSGADGLVLISSGAGGHTGSLTGFSFVPAIRSFFNGPIILGGGIINGSGIKAAEVLGANFSYLGTRFITATTSLASQRYKEIVIESTEADIITSDYFTGVPANFLTTSIIEAGINPKAIKNFNDTKFNSSQETRAWVNIWSAGQGIRMIDKITTVNNIVDDLKKEYDEV